VVNRLAEAETGVETDVLLGDAGLHCEREPLLEEGGDAGDHVVVARSLLHGARLAAHVHEAEVGAGAGDDAGKVRVAAERGDVVHQHGSESKRALGHRGFRRVDRDGNPAQPLENGLHARELLLGRDALRSGPRRLSADVHDRGALLDETASLLDRGIGVEKTPAVREGVRRDVDHAHDTRAWQKVFERLSYAAILDR
jgi:hypothetical protein